MSLPPAPSVIAERKAKLADLVSRDLTIPMAARRMGIGPSHDYRLWSAIRNDLGWQAI